MRRLVTIDEGQTNPFHGLRPFLRGEQLYERDRDVDRLLGQFWSNRVTVLFAPSGVGKSSFLNAKLVPSLEQAFDTSKILISADWAKEDPTSNVRQIRKQLAERAVSSVVILDQFEEVFQSFPNDVLAREIGHELKSLCGRQTDNRLLLVVREEFLAELSIFDRYLPGLLSNYYRLDKFDTARARNIVEQTLASVGQRADELGLATLLSDLAIRSNDLELGAPDQDLPETGDPQQTGVRPTRFIETPSLQLVCYDLWEKRERRNQAAIDDTNSFLAGYRSGDAAASLDSYCRSAFASYGWGRKRLLSEVIPQLTTQHEAKKRVFLSDLVHEIPGSTTNSLRSVLDPLSIPGVSIIRKSQERRRTLSPSGSGRASPVRRGRSIRTLATEVWTALKDLPLLRRAWGVEPGDEDATYQLYHDMYAPLLWKWKAEHDRGRTRRIILISTALAVVVIVFVIMPALRVLSISPILERPSAEVGELTDVMDAHKWLAIVPALDHLVWRRYTAGVAAQESLLEDMDHFLLYRAAAIEGMKGASADIEADADAASRNPLSYLAGSYSVTDAGVIDVTLLPDGTLAGLTRTGQVIALDAERRTPPLQRLIAKRELGTSDNRNGTDGDPNDENRVTRTFGALSADGEVALSYWQSSSGLNTGLGEDLGVLSPTRATCVSLQSVKSGSRVNVLFDGYTKAVVQSEGCEHVLQRAPPVDGEQIRTSQGAVTPISALTDDGRIFASALGTKLLISSGGKADVTTPLCNRAEQSPVDRISHIAILSPTTILFTYVADEQSGVERIGVVKANEKGWKGVQCTAVQGGYLPPNQPNTRLVTRPDGKFLVAVDPTSTPYHGDAHDLREWRWATIGPDGDCRTCDPKDGPIFLPPDVVPQSFSLARRELLFTDGLGRMGLARPNASRLDRGSSTQYVLLPGSLMDQQQFFTTASLASFGSSGHILGVARTERSAVVIRHWNLSSEALWKRAVTLSRNSSEDSRRHNVPAATHQSVCLRNIHSADTRNILGIAKKEQDLRVVCDDSKRWAVGIAGGNSLYYLALDEKGAVSKSIAVASRAVGPKAEVLLGPGERAITILGGGELEVFLPASSPNRAEWSAKVGDLTALAFPQTDAVFLMNRTRGMAYRLTQTVGWPAVVGLDPPIKVRTVLLDQKVLQNQGSGASWVDLDVLKRDFEAEEKVWSTMRGSVPTDKDLCKTTPANSSSGPSPLCVWEERFGLALDLPRPRGGQ